MGIKLGEIAQGLNFISSNDLREILDMAGYITQEEIDI